MARAALSVLTRGLLLLALAAHTSSLWSYHVTWPDGSVTSYTYPKTPHGDCLYDGHSDLLTCQRDHGYERVVTTWVYDPDLIRYVSLRCRRPHPAPLPPSPPAATCLCHQGPQPATPFPCHLHELSPAALADLDQLSVLDLSDNVLQTLAVGTFRSLRGLKVLALARNPIRRLPDGLFCPLTSLEVMTLAQMQLTRFPGGAFRCESEAVGACPVRWLDVSGNHVTELSAGSLWYLPHLTALDLSDNLLHALPAHPLLGADRLQAVDLSRNLLRQLPDQLCEGTPGLRRLTLRGNLLSSLRLAQLSSCSNLSRVDVGGNVLTSLPGPPAPLSRLTHLGLANNRLAALTQPLIAPGNNSLTTLLLSHNDLRHLAPDVMDGMTSLVSLDLGHNSLNDSGLGLSRAFTQLSALRELRLNDNLLTSVGPGHFEGLTSLRTLDLSHNRLDNVAFSPSSPLTQLTHLNLSHNLLTSFSADVIQPLTSLHVLDLSSNLLHHVRDLRVPSALISLDLGDNSLQTVPRLSQADKLLVLRLGLNSIAAVDQHDFRGLTSLRHLDLSRNEVGVMHPLSLTPLSGLLTLVLSHNRLAFNGSHSGRLFSGLPLLTRLDLSHNRLTDVKVISQPNSLTALEDLDVSYNAIGRLVGRLNQWNRTMHLQRVDLEGCRLRVVSRDAFAGLIYLRAVNLQHNRLTHLPLFLSHPGVLYRLHGNPVTCSCHVGWLKQATVQVAGQAVSTQDYEVSTCRTLPRGHLRDVREVARREFLCPLGGSAPCPPGCVCYGQRAGGEAEVVFCTGGVTSPPAALPPQTRVLSLEGGWLGELHALPAGSGVVEEVYVNNSGVTGVGRGAFRGMTALRVLALDHNHLHRLPDHVFSGLTNLSVLSLASNRLRELPDDVFAGTGQLSQLDLSANQLAQLAQDTVRRLRSQRALTEVRLAANPWNCACANLPLLHWVTDNGSAVADVNRVYCDDDPDRPLAREGEGEGAFACQEDSGGAHVAVGVAFTLVAAVAGLSVLLWRWRGVMAALCYSRLGVTCCRPRPHLPGARYDVAVLYDHADRKCRWWVERVLVPRLAGLRVHVPQPGGGVDSIRQSAACLVLASKHFGAHQHTVACLAQALHQARADPTCLVLVTWGELTKQTLECGIRMLLGRRQHVAVTAPFFWDRLLFLLPSPLLHVPGARRHSLIPACRLRTLSDVSESEDKADVDPNDVSNHL